MTGEGAGEGERRAHRRQRGREYLNSEAGAAAAEALGAFIEAIEGEREVRADETQAAVEKRAGFQSTALAALRALISALGALDLLHRRMVAFARNQRMGVISHARDLASLLKPDKLRKDVGRKNMRKMLARVVLDLGLLPGASKAVTWALNLAAGGRDGQFADEGAFDTDPAAGVQSDSGLAYTLQIRLANATGYEAGTNGAPETRRLSEALLAQAVKTFNAWRRGMRAVDKDTVPLAKPTTVRDWCTRLHREQFDLGYKQGCVDRAAGQVNRGKKLHA
jgi:hypothetical protein